LVFTQASNGAPRPTPACVTPGRNRSRLEKNHRLRTKTKAETSGVTQTDAAPTENQQGLMVAAEPNTLENPPSLNSYHRA